MVMDIRKWDIKVNRCQDFIENFLFMCIFMVGFWVQFFLRNKKMCAYCIMTDKQMQLQVETQGKPIISNLLRLSIVPQHGNNSLSKTILDLD